MEPRSRELPPALAVTCLALGIVLIVFGAALVAWPLGLVAFGAMLCLIALLGLEQ